MTMKAEMLREYATNVECNTARIPELLVRSMRIPVQVVSMSNCFQHYQDKRNLA